ncbi:MAG: hypothetical protein JWQ33_2657 [Ramlibacter sp.]|nr:hypothetical protein [Ramlibacter sp.]
MRPSPRLFAPLLRGLLALAVPMMGAAAWTQERSSALPQVTISAKANRDPVEKSYRRMIRGIELFERRHALAPDASLRFRLLPRHRDTDMRDIRVDVVGSTVETRVPVAPDDTFVLPRNRLALDEDAMVVPNRKRQSMTWRTEIRTPGLPPQTRRLGDLRLECEVGMEAGLFSNHRSIFDRLVGALLDTADYCHRRDPRYLFFFDQPLFGVSLVAGQRREALPVSQLYAGASDDPAIGDDLPYCDCEVLLDRSYFLPLGDSSWPDDTLVEFETMQGSADTAGAAQRAVGTIVPGSSTRADVAAVFPKATPIRFDSGYEVWVDRDKPDRRAGRDVELAERIFLVDPSGVVTKARVRPPFAGSP